jgi:hypothetical protein
LGRGKGISKEGLLSRDGIVYKSVTSRNPPLVTTLGGGYGPETWEIHHQFIAEILRKEKAEIKTPTLGGVTY